MNESAPAIDRRPAFAEICRGYVRRL